MRSDRIINVLVAATAVVVLAIILWILFSAVTYVPSVSQYPYVLWPRDNYTVYCEKIDAEKRVGYNCTRSGAHLESFSLGVGDSWAVRK
jgi:hypothetical protein